MSTNSPCLDLVRNGNCSDDEDCEFEHYLPHCIPCQRYFESPNNHKQHLSSKGHQVGVAQYYARAIPRGNKTVECRLCRKEMGYQHWNLHVEGKLHVQNLEDERFKDAKAVAEVNDFGIEVRPEGDLDFGLVEFFKFTDKTYLAQRQKTIEVKAGDQKMSIIKAEWETIEGNRRFSCQSFAKPWYINANKSFEVPVYFHPRNEIGSCKDVLTLTVRVTLPANASSRGSRSKDITFQKTIRGEVGIKEDREKFGAKIPYVRPDIRNRPRANPKNVVNAPKGNFPQNVPWTGKLGWFDCPSWIKDSLEKDKVSGQIKKIGHQIGSLSYQNYKLYWSLVLHCEGYQNELEVRRYDLENVKMKFSNGLYHLEVPGLIEKRPTVLKGDHVKVQMRNASDKTWYEGLADKIDQFEVGLKFKDAFKPALSTTFDVQFTISRIPARRQFQALASPHPRSSLLFPTIATPFKGRPQQVEIDSHPAFMSPLVDANHSQREAVLSIFYGASGPAPYVVFGPPGTGKTVTIIEACQQLVRYSNATILLTAPSNSAADLLCARLGFSQDEVLRLNAPSRFLNDVPRDLMKYCCVSGGTFACPDLEDIMEYKVVVSTCISASILGGIGLKPGYFTHIFVDEAGQATEPEAFLPLSLAASTTSVVLAGDPKQLGPIVQSPISDRFGLNKSLLERLMSTGLYADDDVARRGITYSKLVRNYRNHPAILKTSNEEFYKGELIPDAPSLITNKLSGWSKWPNSSFPIIFHAVKGRDEREGTSPSFFNVAEISQIREYVDSLSKEKRLKLRDSDIGVIAPYAAQCKKLRMALNQYQRPDLTIGSVEQFQGSERSVILISTVRSNSSDIAQDKRLALGFFSEPKRFNVAISRAQAGLVVVGDPEVLAIDPLWRRFLIYVQENGGWQGPAWDSSPYVDNPNYDPVEAARKKQQEFTDRTLAEKLNAMEMGGSATGDEGDWTQV